MNLQATHERPGRHSRKSDNWPPSPTPEKSESGEPSGLQCAGEVRILIVDDDTAVCDVIRAALKGKGYRIDSVSEPDQVEATLAQKKYHLILMDYVIPSLAPEQVFRWVQEHQPDAGIIVITGYPSIEGALNCLRARTYDYVTKPFQIDHLDKLVTRCLESKGLLRMSEDALRELQEALGLVIRERRKALGLTLKQLADRTEVSLGYLSQIELGKNSASIETLYKITLGLGVKLADLFHAVEQRC